MLQQKMLNYVFKFELQHIKCLCNFLVFKVYLVNDFFNCSNMVWFDQEMNIVADGSADKKENVASFDNGVQNLSTAPIKIEPKGTKSNN